MISINKIGLIVAVQALANLFGATQSLAQADVYPVTVTMTGTVQGTGPTGPVALRETLKGDDLLNLARGRALGTPIPANERLSLAVDCDSELIAIFVYDQISSDVLAVVAELEVEEVAVQGSRARSILEMNVESSGNMINALDSGEFLLAGQASLPFPDDDECFTNLKASGLGIIRIVDDGQEIDVLVSKVSVNTSARSIGTANLDDF